MALTVHNSSTNINYFVLGLITFKIHSIIKMILIFWSCFVFILYTYIGYPASLYFLSKFRSPKIKKVSGENKYFVSIIVAARNESLTIKKRICNLLKQNYPLDKIEIIIVSDGSVDDTAKIVEEFVGECDPSMPRIISLSYIEPKGKPHALNIGVSAAAGEIIIFSDARQHFADNAVFELVANFSDHEVGAVSGELFFREKSESNIRQQMGVYWKYEKMIRKLESQTGSVVGATGAIYAIRKSLFKDLPLRVLLDDVLTPLNIAMQKRRVVYDSCAQAFDYVSANINQEWSRKVRTLAGNWQLLSLRPELFVPWKNPLFFRFFWHKIARLLVPFFLMLLFFGSVFNQGLFYDSFALLQIIIYIVALSAHFSSKLQQYRSIKFVYFFTVMNIAALKGFFVWLIGDCGNVWKKY